MSNRHSPVHVQLHALIKLKQYLDRMTRFNLLIYLNEAIAFVNTDHHTMIEGKLIPRKYDMVVIHIAERVVQLLFPLVVKVHIAKVYIQHIPHEHVSKMRRFGLYVQILLGRTHLSMLDSECSMSQACGVQLLEISEMLSNERACAPPLGHGLHVRLYPRS